ncbi:MAG: nucleotidyltransferase substrate binding protein [Pseudobdellovibrio sp.]|nr:nucleotidyltransferase substrate binding protein [Pseudobdellovibrio sp.]
MDIRWIQRFNNFEKALTQLQAAHNLSQQRMLNDLEKQGLIQAFEFTHELAWNVLKDYIEYSGGQSLIGSKDTTREAFQKNLISHGDTWMEMIKSRNLTSHTYNQDTASAIVRNILELYVSCFVEFSQKMKSLIK